MSVCSPHFLIGTFALITLLATSAAIGRVFGIGVGEALYLTGLVLVVLGGISQRLRRSCTHASENREA